LQKLKFSKNAFSKNAFSKMHFSKMHFSKMPRAGLARGAVLGRGRGGPPPSLAGFPQSSLRNQFQTRLK